MRNNAILQTPVGPGEEHTTLAGLPTEASIWNAVEAAIPGFLQNVYAHTAGGGKFLGILQVKKRQPADEGRQGQAALLALATYSELKNIILVDEDVDIFDSDDILWAMTTRMQGTSALRQSPAFAVTSWIRPRRRNTARRSVEMASAARPFLTARSTGAEIAL